ncbi:MAG TPA: DUF29 domain-containing protein [Bryobacteraceae bacterium]|nr:DUF29 domain-containing protein [Bryobacteraceae bacterium]
MEKRLKNIDDAYQWSVDTVAALRAADFSRIDLDELINEIGSIASGLRRELVSALRQVIEALLVAEYAHANDKERTANECQSVKAQGQLQLLLSAAPGLKAILGEAVEEAYGDARQFVTEDFDVALPDRCPFPLERITENPYQRLVAIGQLA